jgi:hypothetical protein
MGGIADRILAKDFKSNSWKAQMDFLEKKVKADTAQAENKEVKDEEKPSDEEAKTNEEAKKAFTYDPMKHGWIAAMVVIVMGIKTGKINLGSPDGNSNALDILKAFINPEDIKMANSFRDSLGLGILEDVARVAKAVGKEMEKENKKLEDYNKMSEQQKQMMLIGGDPKFAELVTYFDPIENSGVAEAG